MTKRMSLCFRYSHYLRRSGNSSNKKYTLVYTDVDRLYQSKGRPTLQFRELLLGAARTRYPYSICLALNITITHILTSWPNASTLKTSASLSLFTSRITSARTASLEQCFRIQHYFPEQCHNGLPQRPEDAAARRQPGVSSCDRRSAHTTQLTSEYHPHPDDRVTSSLYIRWRLQPLTSPAEARPVLHTQQLYQKTTQKPPTCQPISIYQTQDVKAPC